MKKSQNGPLIKPKVVVIGGGYAGLTFTYLLKQKDFFDVVLIDPKDFMIHYVATLRSAVVRGMQKRIFIPYQKVVGSSFLQGSVASINSEKNFVQLLDGDQIRYDQLVLAVGLNSQFPKKSAEVDTLSFFREQSRLQQEISASRKIVIVGGGPVGVEMSGEIKDQFPSAEVTLVHSKDILVSPRTNNTFQQKLRELLKKKKINLITNERIVNIDKLITNRRVDKQTLISDKGNHLYADLVIPCIGNKTSSKTIKESFGKAVNKDGLVTVDRFLRISSYDNVFAIGDITNLNEEKSALNARMHARLLASNIIANAKDKPMKVYRPYGFMMLIAMGRKDGICQLHGKVFGSFVTRFFKSKDLQTERTWRNFGLKAPSDYEGSLLCCVHPKFEVNEED